MEDIIQSILFGLANQLGVQPITMLAILGVIVSVCNLLGRAIPDSATGVLGIIRKIAKVLGLYLSNRVSPSVTVNDVSRAVVAEVPDSSILSSANDLKDAVATGTAVGASVGGVAEAIIDRARGLEPGRAYVPGESPEDGSVVPDEYRTDGPFAAQKRLGE